MAKDVSAFLVWTAEPKLERRHATGLAVVIFLIVASILSYFAYRNIWAEAKRKVRVTGALEPQNQAKSRRAKGREGVAG
jgi:ubiquinol-cytochrome c reductase cytochrome c1 subunit